MMEQELAEAKDLKETKEKGLLKLTDEQIAIIQTRGNITINAVAGSGKTTTIIEYAATRPENSRILYLAFNRSVKLEAEKKFSARRLTNVKVETAHSLAYRQMMQTRRYEVKAQGYKTHEIVELLQLVGTGEKHAEYVIASHINKFITYFCNSDKPRVQDLNYLDTIYDSKAKAFAKSIYKYIEDGTRLLLAKMDKGEIPIIHDFYLKKFQLSNPSLPYDYILFDEAQDASAAMLDVFMKQKGVKVIVGDMHQQIYSWRYAVNSLAMTDFQKLNLSTSFRFPQQIADLANDILLWKNHLDTSSPVTISGKGVEKEEKTKATIARTNLGLLFNAIGYITDNRKVKHIYFEGNINSYTYADDGASLYDVLNLYNEKKDGIRDKLIHSMKNIDELEEYIEKTEDVQLGMMVEIVKEYGNEIYDIIRSLKNLHTGDDDKSKAEMIFSTVHRAKGMEYDVVHLVDDFVTEVKLEKLSAEKDKDNKSKKEPLNIVKWNEEINLLYVAVTRAKNKLHLAESYLPKNYKANLHVEFVKAKKAEIPVMPPASNSFQQLRLNKKLVNGKASKFKPKANNYSQKSDEPDGAYQPWTAISDREMLVMYEQGFSLAEIAAQFGRTKGAIIARLKKKGWYVE